MKPRIVALVLGFLAVFALLSGCFEFGRAHADGSGSAGAAAGSAASTPADKLHDPISQPSASWDDLKAAKKVGWPVAVFAGLVLLCKLLGRAKQYKLLAVLGTGKTAVVIAAAGAIAASCYNAAADGGAWTALLVAGVTSLGHYLDAGGKTPAS